MANEMNIVQQVAHQAFETFDGSSEPTVRQENQRVLKELVAQVNCADVNFDVDLLTRGVNGDENNTPVTYVHMWEDSTFSMGLFVLRRGGTLPLHDHPDMYGLIKVLHGQALIKSYSGVAGVEIPEDVKEYIESSYPFTPLVEIVRPLPDQEVDITTPPCELSPEKGNFHEIKSVDGPMVFLDILAPPYEENSDQEDARECHYYTDTKLTSNSMRFLVQGPRPDNYKCNEAPYRGPELSEETVTGSTQP